MAARPPRGGIQPARLFHGGDGPSVFAKKGGDPAAARRFEAELDGLSRLGASGAVRTPGVLGLLHLPHGAAALVLEAIHAVRPTRESWIELGRQVAALHGHTSHGFGLDRDNFIGLEPQPNGPMPDWPRFYAERRLRPMLDAAAASGNLPADAARQVERLIEKILRDPGVCGPPGPPALLHGDLWTANVLFAPRGPVVIDPAVYHGHREMEVAFTELFGPFDPAFYRAYEEARPLAPGYADRRALWQVYPLLVHVRGFGRGYLRPLRAAVGRYL